MENINEEDDPKPLRIIGTPVMENGRFVLHEYAILNRECGWLCPRCGTEVRICPTSAGRQIHSCSYCGTTFQIEVDAEAVTYLHKKKEEILPQPLPEERRENEKPAGEAKSPIPAGRVIAPPPAGKAISSPVAQKETVSVSVGMLQWGSFINKHKHWLIFF